MKHLKSDNFKLKTNLRYNQQKTKGKIMNNTQVKAVYEASRASFIAIVAEYSHSLLKDIREDSEGKYIKMGEMFTNRNSDTSFVFEGFYLETNLEPTIPSKLVAYVSMILTNGSVSKKIKKLYKGDFHLLEKSYGK